MRILLVALAGGSGSGKTTLARALAADLGPERVALLAQDCYYRDRGDLEEAARAGLNYDVPDALDVALFRRHLAALRQGEAITPPRYCFATHRRDGVLPAVEPREIVLVEGILLFHDRQIREIFDLRIFVDAPDHLRLTRRVARDVAERGRAADAVLAQCRATVFPAHARYVEPTRAFADLVLVNAGRLQPVAEVASAVIRMRLARRRAAIPASAA